MTETAHTTFTVPYEKSVVVLNVNNLDSGAVFINKWEPSLESEGK